MLLRAVPILFRKLSNGSPPETHAKYSEVVPSAVSTSLLLAGFAADSPDFGWRSAFSLCGLAGAYLSVVSSEVWIEHMSAGRGFIAIALVIFAFWRPALCLVGAYFFGAFACLPFTLQARGVTVAPELFQALPYVMTILVLVTVSAAGARRRLGAPGALGTPYVREER